MVASQSANERRGSRLSGWPGCCLWRRLPSCSASATAGLSPRYGSSDLSTRGVRLALANTTVIAAGVLTYIILHVALGLSPATSSAVAGSVLTAVLSHGMLFDGLPRVADDATRERLTGLGAVTLVAAVLYGALTALADQAQWSVHTGSPR
jgi:hypothetical protein